MIPRIIPVLLVKNSGLVKGIEFKNYRYIGDPINAVRIFNEREVDEIIVFDIDANRHNRCIDIELIEKLADECYMPFAVGGGIKTLEDAERIITAGAEKVVLNTSILTNPELIKQISSIFGNQSVVACLDLKRNFFGKYCVYGFSGEKKFSKMNPIEQAILYEKCGAGEILINSINYDGKMSGYDFELLKSVSSEIKNVPLIAGCGAGNLMDMYNTNKKLGITAYAAGSLFVYYGSQRGVLINYPDRNKILKIFKEYK